MTAVLFEVSPWSTQTGSFAEPSRRDGEGPGRGLELFDAERWRPLLEDVARNRHRAARSRELAAISRCRAVEQRILIAAALQALEDERAIRMERREQRRAGG